MNESTSRAVTQSSEEQTGGGWGKEVHTYEASSEKMSHEPFWL